jgi:hypothetical protein
MPSFIDGYFHWDELLDRTHSSHNTGHNQPEYPPSSFSAPLSHAKEFIRIDDNPYGQYVIHPPTGK